MTDKEIRIIKDGVISIFEKFSILNHAVTIGSLRDDILRLIGSMQERPGLKFNVGDKVRNDKIAGLPICTIESIDDTTYYCDYTNFDIIVQDKWELVEETTSFDEAIQEGDDVRYNEDLGCRVNLSQLKRVAKKDPRYCMYSKDDYTDEDRKALCEDCEEECRFNKKEDSVNDSFEAEVKKLWEEINTGHSYSIVDSYNIFYGLCMDIADWQKEQQNIIEPTGKEQVKESLISKHEDKTCKENGNSLTQEPISGDLEEAIDTYLKSYWGGEKEKQDWPFLKKMAIHFAEWQKKKDDYAIKIAHMAGEEEGKNIMKQQMMAKAVDATVHIDAGNYPYIPQIELYDYDKDIPLAKEGDKYKVVLIKE